MPDDRPDTTIDRRKAKRIVLRTRAKAMTEDDWLREYLRDRKRREKIFRGTLAFTKLTGFTAEELARPLKVQGDTIRFLGRIALAALLYDGERANAG